jgi:hypothetical protein
MGGGGGGHGKAGKLNFLAGNIEGSNAFDNGFSTGMHPAQKFASDSRSSYSKMAVSSYGGANFQKPDAGLSQGDAKWNFVLDKSTGIYRSGNDTDNPASYMNFGTVVGGYSTGESEGISGYSAMPVVDYPNPASGFETSGYLAAPASFMTGNPTESSAGYLQHAAASSFGYQPSYGTTGAGIYGTSFGDVYGQDQGGYGGFTGSY